MEAALLAVLFVVSLVYLFVTYNNNYWKRRGVPQATPLPIVGNSLDLLLLKKCMGLVHADIYRKYSKNDAVGFYEFHTPKLMVRSPALIKQVLVSEFSNFRDNVFEASMKLDPRLELNAFVTNGERWKRARTTLSSGLTLSKVKDMYELMKQSVPSLNTHIENHLGQEVEAVKLSTHFILNVVSNSVFGIQSDCFTNPDAPFLQMSELMLEGVVHSWWQFYFFFFQSVRNFIRHPIVAKKVVTFVESMVRTVIEAKLKSNIARKDYFQHYLKKDTPVEKNMEEIINLGMAFFLSGSETSYVPLSNTLYELAKNPGVQQKLFEELQEAFAGKSELDYETLQNLPYLDKVIKESMRKYPTVYTIARVCTAETILDIDDKTALIEVGTNIIVPVFSIHRDPIYYPNPDVFDPDRFNEDRVAGRPQFTFLALGAGPRECPGKRFGFTQMKLFLSNIVYKYKVLPSRRTPPCLELSPYGYFLTVASEIWLQFERRSTTSTSEIDEKILA